jgi:hypothetical protein
MLSAVGNLADRAARTTEEGHPSHRRRVIIVGSHFPPSNLASIHRSRLFAQHLPEFGWEPIIVTADHSYYEEPLDWNLNKLVASDLRVERVAAIPTRPIRLVGDMGIRAFPFMLRRILRLTNKEKIDFLYITVPSFYGALLGRVVRALRGTPFGIDYIDPWVHTWEGSKRRFSKAWLSRKLGEWLEPFAVRNASLITGVTEKSYADVFVRNPHLKETAISATMPYGGEVSDHRMASSLGLTARLFDNDKKFRMIYAGTMWDAAQGPLDRVFRSIAANRERFDGVRFYFVGTGTSPTDPQPQIRPIAERYGIYGDVVVENPQRIPYLEVLVHLEAADAVFIFGSTKPHYTPSKVYQAVLSGKPILAVLHGESTAASVIRDTKAGQVLTFDGENDLSTIDQHFAGVFGEFRSFAATFDPSTVDKGQFELYSARSVASTLAASLDLAVRKAAQPIHEGMAT